jgi:uncharacterized protein (DUF1015 family)
VTMLKPFRGLRYDPAVAGDLAAVVAPPYDVIDPDERARLHERSPYNVVRLILSEAPDPYASAARALAEWRAAGVLALDPSPALYLYAQQFPAPAGGARERAGVIGALRLERFETGRVRPHERTFAEAKNDRLSLLRACRTSLSPIFGLVSIPDWRFGALLPSRPPEIDLVDEAGVRHRMWRLAEPAAIAAAGERIAARDVFIADGHHRYETALAYRDEVRAALGPAAPPPGAAPYDYVLAYLTTMEDPGLVVLPTHRILPSLAVAAADLRTALARHFTVEELPWTAAGLTALLERLDGATGAGPGAGARDRRGEGVGGGGDGDARGAGPGTAREGIVRIGAAVRGAGALWLLTAARDALPFPAELPAPLRALDVTALHRIVLAGVLGLPLGARGGAPGLGYTQDAARALATVARGEAAAAFFLPATDVAALRAVSLAGLTMPEKSTYFHPKLLTGLVLYPFDAAEGAAAGAAAG